MSTVATPQGSVTLAPLLHPNDQGVKWVAGKPYYWVKENGRLSLRRWPDDDDGNPVPYDDLPKDIS